MGRFILIVVGAAALLGTFSLHNGAGSSATRAVMAVSGHADRVVAREIALSAHSATLRALWEDFTQNGTYDGPSTIEGTYQSGTYSSTIDVQPGKFTIETRAKLSGADYVVREAYLVCDDPSQPDVPAWMAHAVVLDDDFHITGTATIASPPGMNANIHTNGRLTGNGNPSVSGFGSYSKTAGNINQLSQIFVPNENPDGFAHVYKTDAVDLPPFNAQDYKDKATIVTQGSLVLDGATLGTRSNPVIWYVAGDLHVNGGLLSGYGIFVVEGDIRVNGDTTVEGGVCGGNESTVAFYSTGDVMINGGATLRGQIYAGGSARMNGTAAVFGNVASKGDTNFSGTFSINYRHASSALTKPIWPGESGIAPGILVRSSYVEGG